MVVSEESFGSVRRNWTADDALPEAPRYRHAMVARL